MLRHREVQTLPYEKKFLYDLVLDVESYPAFLPWCQNVRITEKKKSFLKADVYLEVVGIKERFCSHVCFKEEDRISIRYLDGNILKSLESFWHFEPSKQTEGECLVVFDIAFSLQNTMLDKIFSTALQRVAKKMVAAFEARACELHTKQNPAMIEGNKFPK